MCSMKLNRFDVSIVGYSLILLIGGVVGYLVAGSLASLLMSSISTILLIGSLFLIRFFPAMGYRVVYTLLTLLGLFFAYRWYTIKFMPSGLLTLLTVVVLAMAVYWNKKD